MSAPDISRPALTTGPAEFVALMAMLVAIVAFSIDAMLPALPEVAAELTPAAPNSAQLIVTSFVLGMGLGTFVVGPISDSFGRKPVILWGAGLYCFAAALAWAAPSLELVIAARILQGLGASAARVVTMALIRDFYAGRGMARIVGFVMMVFTLVPAVAPLIGSFIVALAGWRGIFAAFVLFAVCTTSWLMLRVAEPLPPAARRPFRPRAVRAGVREVLAHPVVRHSTLVQALCMTALFASLSTIQPIFDITYGRAAGFPWWFCLIALVSGAFSLVNAAVVVRLGMRRLVRVAMLAFIGLSVVVLIWSQVAAAGLPFWAYVLWQMAAFIHVAMTLGNLNAIALEPMGHLAGTATSVFSALATVGAVALSVPIGLMFNGTAVPLIFGALVAIALGYTLMRVMPDEV